MLDFAVSERNRYACEKLAGSPERLANFQPITRNVFQAFLGINVIMGMNRLPSVAMYWSSGDFFGNQGIKKVMPRNRFEEIRKF